MTCECGHRLITHRYLFGSGANTGECLASGCDCTSVQESEA